MPATFEVHVEIGGVAVHAGTVFFNHRGRHLSTVFRYEPTYMASPLGYSIDPAMPLTQGQHVTEGMPGTFGDTSPDRWGRQLITKRIREICRRSRFSSMRARVRLAVPAPRLLSTTAESCTSQSSRYRATSGT